MKHHLTLSDCKHTPKCSVHSFHHSCMHLNAAPKLVTGTKVDTGDKYLKRITCVGQSAVQVDVYDVLNAFNVTCPATQHAIKKLLNAGKRGHKDAVTDLSEAMVSIQRAKGFALQET